MCWSTSDHVAHSLSPGFLFVSSRSRCKYFNKRGPAGIEEVMFQAYFPNKLLDNLLINYGHG